MKKVYIQSALIAVAIAAMAPMSASAQKDPDVQALEKYVYPGNSAARPANFTYLPDGKSYALLSRDKKRVVTYDLATGKELETLFDTDHTRETTLAAIEGFELSPEGSKVLVWTDKEPIYRHSFTAKYYVYECRTRLLRPLSTENERQQVPVISPDGRMVAFVSDNNLYIKKLDYNTQVAVTTDGAKNQIINGVPDWAYEEEFGTNRSISWSPDCTTLCWLKYDESEVPLYSFPLYQGACDPMNQYALYPGQFTYKYPVAGETNSRVTLHSYDVDTRKTKDITLPDSRIEYIPSIEFAPNGNLMTSTLNRDQNHYEIYSVNPKSTVAKSIYSEDSKAWINPLTYSSLTLSADGFALISSRNGYNHIYKYSYAGALIRQITNGDFDVMAYYGADAAGNHYYQAAAPLPRYRTVYRVDAKGVVKAISADDGNASATFTPGCTACVINYNNSTTPPIYTLCKPDGKAMRQLVDNKEYAAKYASLPKKEFFEFTSREGVLLYGWMIKPNDFDPQKKYPVVMYQYSGPGSQEVQDRWRPDWDYYFAETQGYIIICVDGRGTTGRGNDFMYSVYRNLGHYETIDQIATARYAASLPYVDATKMGIFGWSYGGYEALLCASSDECPWAAAVAIAPVTDWRYYDTIYAERFMLTPKQNETGYYESAPINFTRNLKCPLMIMSGTADDNVHPANTYEYISRLQLNGTLFDMMMFTNKNHSIYGCGARAVVYGNMLRYFNRMLK